MSSVPLSYTALPTPLSTPPPQPPLLLPLYFVSGNNGLYFQLVLLGAEEGLYSMSLEKPGRSSPRALPGIDRAFQLDIISDLNLLIMIAGTIYLYATRTYKPPPPPPPVNKKTHPFISTSLACIEMNYIFYDVLRLKNASNFKKCYKKALLCSLFLKRFFSPDLLKHVQLCAHLLCSCENLVNFRRISSI